MPSLALQAVGLGLQAACRPLRVGGQGGWVGAWVKGDAAHLALSSREGGLAGRADRRRGERLGQETRHVATLGATVAGGERRAGGGATGHLVRGVEEITPGYG